MSWANLDSFQQQASTRSVRWPSIRGGSHGSVGCQGKEASRRPDERFAPRCLPCRRRSYCGGRMDGDTNAPAGDDVAVRRYLRCTEQRSRYLIKASRARPMSRQSGHLLVAGGGNPRRRASSVSLGQIPAADWRAEREPRCHISSAVHPLACDDDGERTMTSHERRSDPRRSNE